MRHTRRLVGRISLIYFLLLLNACGADPHSPLLGVWKEENLERYLVIAKRAHFGSAANSVIDTAASTDLTAIIYAPASKPAITSLSTKNKGFRELSDAGKWNHMSLPVSLHDGTLHMHYNDADIPVLYDPLRKKIVLNGINQFKRVSSTIP